MALAGNGGPLTAPNFFELTPAERGRLTGDALQEALTASGRGERAFWREYLVDSGLTYNALHGRLWRARKGITTEAPKWDIGKPLELDMTDCIVFGDVHLPMASNEWIANMLMVAEKKLKKGRRVGFLVGDMMNGSPWSRHDRMRLEPHWKDELKAARDFVALLYTVFDLIVYSDGNHDDWLARFTGGEMGIQDIAYLVGGGDRMMVSEYDYVNVNMPTGKWMFTHSKRYSKDPLKVANQLATFHKCHVIQHHEHHLGMTWNDQKEYLIVNNGGLFDAEQFSYVQHNISSRPRMVNGFTLMLDGYPTVFGPEPFTNWDKWK